MNPKITHRFRFYLSLIDPPWDQTDIGSDLVTWIDTESEEKDWCCRADWSEDWVGRGATLELALLDHLRKRLGPDPEP